MRKKRKWDSVFRANGITGKTALCGTIVVILIMGCLMRAVSADSPGVSKVFDPDRTGSITLYKLLENGTNGTLSEGTGTDEGNTGRTAMQGISFRAKKIAEISTLTVREGSALKTGVYFTSVDTAFHNAYRKAAGRELSGAVTSESGETGYETKTLIDAVAVMQKSRGDGSTYTGETLLKDVALGGTVSFDRTDAGGKTSKSGLPLGLYLVAEDEENSKYERNTDPVRAVAGAATPFLISLPMTSLTQIGSDQAGSVWQYDVTAYPKNSTITTEKYIVSQSDADTLRKTEDWQIGDTITQVITADAPKIVSVSGDETAKNYTEFTVNDSLSEGMEFIRVSEVRVGAAVLSPRKKRDFTAQTALDPADYRVTVSGNGSVITTTLLPGGLAKLNALSVDGAVTVIFESRLTGKAVISGEGGSDGVNSNRPDVAWHTETDVRRTLEGTPVHHFTYALELTKTGVTDFSSVAFSMRKSGAGAELAWIREKEGVYHPARTGESGTVTLLVPDSGGVLLMRGLDSTSYVLTERKTQKGRMLLTSPVEITLKGKSSPDGILERAAAKVDGTIVALPVRGSGQSGIAQIKVSNHGQVLLKTGGQGVWRYMISALLIFFGVAGLALVLRRRENR